MGKEHSNILPTYRISWEIFLVWDLDRSDVCEDFTFNNKLGVCTSGLDSDLRLTDQIAREVIEELMKSAPERSKKQYQDNHKWITQADSHKLVVGSQARILYSDAKVRP